MLSHPQQGGYQGSTSHGTLAAQDRTQEGSQGRSASGDRRLLYWLVLTSGLPADLA